MLDDSISSQFVMDSFGYDQDHPENLILYANKFQINGNDFYLTIQKAPFTPEDFVSIPYLDCTSKNNGSSYSFSLRNGFSPTLSLHEQLHKLIIESISPIITCNLTHLFKSILDRAFDSINTSAWRFASGNSVIHSINHIIQKFADKITSHSLLPFVVPSIHELIPSDSFDEFKDCLCSLTLPEMDEIQSLTILDHSSWSYAIREGLTIDIEDFLIPISSHFDKELFISEILIDETLSLPSEIIDH